VSAQSEQLTPEFRHLHFVFEHLCPVNQYDRNIIAVAFLKIGMVVDVDFFKREEMFQS